MVYYFILKSSILVVSLESSKVSVLYFGHRIEFVKYSMHLLHNSTLPEHQKTVEWLLHLIKSKIAKKNKISYWFSYFDLK